MGAHIPRPSRFSFFVCIKSTFWLELCRSLCSRNWHPQTNTWVGSRGGAILEPLGIPWQYYHQIYIVLCACVNEDKLPCCIFEIMEDSNTIRLNFNTDSRDDLTVHSLRHFPSRAQNPHSESFMLVRLLVARFLVPFMFETWEQLAIAIAMAHQNCEQEVFMGEATITTFWLFSDIRRGRIFS